MSAPAHRSSKNAMDIRGLQLGKYQLLDCIAESYMSKIYRARVQFGESNRVVAIKTLHPSAMQNAKSTKLFFREIEISQALQHPNIVQIHDFGEFEDGPYIVMEWVQGRNLKEILAKQPLSAPAACWMMIEAAKALAYAHSYHDKLTGSKMSVVHGDLSPHNLMISFDGSLKLIDFGIARLVTEDSHTVTDAVRGKMGYLAPEQLKSAAAPSVQSDLFSLGCIFWEALTGKKLFAAHTDYLALGMLANCDMTVSSEFAKYPKMPPALQAILASLLKSDPKERTQSAYELQSQLEKLGVTGGQAKMAAVMTAHFSQEISTDRKKLLALIEEVSQMPVQTPVETPAESPRNTHTATLELVPAASPSASPPAPAQRNIRGVSPTETHSLPELEMPANDQRKLPKVTLVKVQDEPIRLETNAPIVPQGKIEIMDLPKKLSAGQQTRRILFARAAFVFAVAVIAYVVFHSDFFSFYLAHAKEQWGSSFENNLKNGPLSQLLPIFKSMTDGSTGK